MTWSGGRSQIDAMASFQRVGNTVDVPNANWTNTIGAAELITVWKDPELSIQHSAPSTTRESSRYRRRVGLPMTRNTSG